MKQKIFFVLILLAVMLVGCSTEPAQSNPVEDKIVVFTSIVPQQYFVDRIGGVRVKALTMVEPGASPATYEPKPSQMAALSEAVMYFSIGVPFENSWLEKIADSNPEMQITDTTVGIEKRVMTEPHTHEGEDHLEEEHEGDEHQDVENEYHQEGELDPHVWLSPALVKIQAQNIYAALVKVAPQYEAEFTQNLEAFYADIDQLEAEIQTTLADVENQKFMVFHPSWGYFADEFGLEMIAIEVGGTEPSAAELAALIEEAQEEDIRVVFAQPEFSTQDAATIAKAIDGEVILISPLAYDWLENMQLVADKFAEVLQ